MVTPTGQQMQEKINKMKNKSSVRYKTVSIPKKGFGTPLFPTKTVSPTSLRAVFGGHVHTGVTSPVTLTSGENIMQRNHIKIEILYDNGKLYHVKAFDYHLSTEELSYLCQEIKKVDKVTSVGGMRYSVPLNDVAAIMIKNLNTKEITIKQLKPCAQVKVELSKKVREQKPVVPPLDIDTDFRAIFGSPLV